MEPYTLRFNRVHPKKTAVCFTFDDNFERHGSVVAPAFLSRGMACTFYINPGTKDFASAHLQRCRELLLNGFEIGSHGDTHENLVSLPPADALRTVRAAAARIHRYLGVYPATFAFPYHAYTGETLAMARGFHLETRNTLAESEWFPIKADVSRERLLAAIRRCIAARRPLVFSGHSVRLSQDGPRDENGAAGPNPLPLGDLAALLDFLETQREYAQVITFEQAALLAYLSRYGAVSGDTFRVTPALLEPLRPYHIGVDRLASLM